MALNDGIRIPVLKVLGHKHFHLHSVISRWLACVAHVQSVLLAPRKDNYTCCHILSSGLWFTCTYDLTCNQEKHINLLNARPVGADLSHF